GTDLGASRYNGSWLSLSERDGLPAGKVGAIAQTADAALWFGTQAGGVVRCAADGSACSAPWTTAQGLPDNDVRALLPANGGEKGLWVGTARGLARMQGDKILVEEQMRGVEIRSLAAGADGALLVGTADRGVWKRAAGGAWQRVGDQEPLRGAVNAICVDRGGRLWAGTDVGLFVFQSGGWRLRQLIEGEDQTPVHALALDRRGRVWVGTDEGLIYPRDPRAPESFDGWLSGQPGGLVNSSVRAMTFAGDGSLWVGTVAGVSRYDEETWQTIRDEAVIGQRINAILLDSDGHTWVGTEFGGLLFWNGQAWEQVALGADLSDSRVIALYQDTRGRIWIATETGIGYRTSAGKLVSLTAAFGAARLPVYAIAQDASGVLVLGARGGASRFNEQGAFQPIPELEGKRVNAVQRGNDGVLWFGTEANGLWRLANNRLEEVFAPGGVRFGSVVLNGIALSKDGTLWVATYESGLWRLADDRWQQIDAPLPTPRILTLKYLDNGLWVGTRQGFARFDGKSWQSYAGDALPSLEILALAAGPAGSMWIGTGSGLVRYTPDRQPPWVRIEAVNLNRPINGRITLMNDTLTELRLSGGDLATRPEYIRFLTQLEGVDAVPQFHPSGQVTLGERRLASGTYRLRAWARDDAMNYSSPAEVLIVVPRMVRLPGGQAVPYDILIAALALGMVTVGSAGAAGYVSWRARRQERARTEALAERRREALERRFNPYISGEPVRQPDMFFGRDDLLRKIVNALHQNSIMIHGERRMGKTTLLYQLGQALREANDPEWVFIPVSIDLEGTPQDRLFYTLMEAIWGVTQAYLATEPPTLQFHRLPPDEYTDREFSADLREIIAALKPIVAPRRLRIILLIDEMDAIDGYERIIQLQLRRIFMSPLAENLGAVVAGVHINKAWDRLESPWYNLFNEIPLEPFTDEQARQLLIEPVRGVYEWTPEAVEYVIARAGGRPYRLQQFALEAVNQMLVAGRFHITLEDVQAADRIIEGTR
ncbi:MAG: two-component regulator propeller domain-containing protein, partial [Anaerolineae bacterium]